MHSFSAEIKMVPDKMFLGICVWICLKQKRITDFFEQKRRRRFCSVELWNEILVFVSFYRGSSPFNPIKTSIFAKRKF